MIDHLGTDGLLSLDDDDADIRDEFACAGREVTFGFDALARDFGRPPVWRCWNVPKCAGTNLLVTIDRGQQHK